MKRTFGIIDLSVMGVGSVVIFFVSNFWLGKGDLQQMVHEHALSLVLGKLFINAIVIGLLLRADYLLHFLIGILTKGKFARMKDFDGVFAEMFLFFMAVSVISIAAFVVIGW